MADQSLYLRPDVIAEPLVDQWYAWPHIIAPHTAALNIVERHLRLMESYVSAPAVHAAAVREPTMRGGPFLDYDRPRVAEVRELMDTTKRQRKHFIKLAHAIKDANRLLQTRADGHSLEPLYREIPEVLQGYVELVYDLNNHASMRFLEPLLYRSEYYDLSLQSLMLSRIPADDRPFILSTPRLPNAESVQLRIPFDSPAIDLLFSTTHEPRPFEEILDCVGLDEDAVALFRSFFTTSAPPAYSPPSPGTIRWRYFGHACILIETRGTTILADPILSYTHDRGISRYTYQDLPPCIDYVLITHNHQDHILFETLLQIRHKLGTIVVPRSGSGSLQDPSLKHLLNAIGFTRVVEVDSLESISFDDGCITSIPFFGEHGDLDIRAKSGYHVRLGRHTLMFLADSRNMESRVYERLHTEVGDVDVLFIGMECDGAPMSWIYGPLLTSPLEWSRDQSRRLSGSDFQQSMDLVNQFHCRHVYVYAMGMEPWLNHISRIKYTDESRPMVESRRLIESCRSKGILAERLYGEKELVLN
jgi:L-ascorbate metabolism protein UlaG (beta-lactamase superfamily)